MTTTINTFDGAALLREQVLKDRVAALEADLALMAEKFDADLRDVTMGVKADCTRELLQARELVEFFQGKSTRRGLELDALRKALDEALKFIQVESVRKRIQALAGSWFHEQR